MYPGKLHPRNRVMRDHQETSTNLSINQDRHNNLTATLRIACNVPREVQNIRNNNSLLLRSSSTTNTLSEPNLLTRRLSMERPEKKKLVLRGRVCS